MTKLEKYLEYQINLRLKFCKEAQIRLKQSSDFLLENRKKRVQETEENLLYWFDIVLDYFLIKDDAERYGPCAADLAAVIKKYCPNSIARLILSEIEEDPELYVAYGEFGTKLLTTNREAL